MSKADMNYEPPQRNNGQLLRVEAMNTKLASGISDYIELFPYITSYSEVFNQTWNVEDVYGRMDGIPNYLNTKRTINLTLRVMAANLAQAKENLYLISKFARFCYPGVTKKDGLHNIKAAPILRLKLGTIIKDSASDGGLYGFINGGLTITPLIEYGWFTPIRTIDIPKLTPAETLEKQYSLEAARQHKNVKSERANPNREEQNVPGTEDTLLFKYVELSFQYNVLHNHLLGQDIEDQTGYRYWQARFPYGVDKPDFALDANDTPVSQIDHVEPFPVGFASDSESFENQQALEESLDVSTFRGNGRLDKVIPNRYKFGHDTIGKAASKTIANNIFNNLWKK